MTTSRRLRSATVAGLMGVARTRPFEAAVRGLDRLERWPADRLAVLTYHRVDREDRAGRSPWVLSATPEAFERQIRWLAARFRPVGGEQVIEAIRSGGRLAPRSVLVTFDDAYDDLAEHAWPILRRHGVPAVLFVPTAYPDRPDRAFWWDRLDSAVLAGHGRRTLDTPFGRLDLADRAARRRAVAALREELRRREHDEAMAIVDGLLAELGAPPPASSVLGWDALRALAGEGLGVAAHTRSHPLLSRLPADRLDDEVGGSVEDLRRAIPAALPLFAYPSGGLDERAVAAVRRAGVVAAFTTERGVNDLASADPLRLRRFNVGPRSSVGLLHVQLLPRVRRLADRVPR